MRLALVLNNRAKVVLGSGLPLVNHCEDVWT